MFQEAYDIFGVVSGRSVLESPEREKNNAIECRMFLRDVHSFAALESQQSHDMVVNIC